MQKRILFLLDESGSMGSMAREAIGGFNAWKKALELVENDVRITVVTFNEGTPRIVYNDVPVRKVPDMTLNDFHPDNMTALYDAIAWSIDHVDRKMQQDDSALVVILTDGEENASRHTSHDMVRKMITDRQTKGWAFSFLSSDLDAVETAQRMGIARSDTVYFEPDQRGMATAYAAITTASMTYLSGEREDQSTWQQVVENNTSTVKTR